MSHTPTPWIEGNSTHETIDIESGENALNINGGAIVCRLYGKERIANGELIIKAVNAWNDPKALRARLIEMGW